MVVEFGLANRWKKYLWLADILILEPLAKV